MSLWYATDGITGVGFSPAIRKRELRRHGPHNSYSLSSQVSFMVSRATLLWPLLTSAMQRYSRDLLSKHTITQSLYVHYWCRTLWSWTGVNGCPYNYRISYPHCIKHTIWSDGCSALSRSCGSLPQRNNHLRGSHPLAYRHAWTPQCGSSARRGSPCTMQ